MTAPAVTVGFVGAGGICRSRHLPALAAMDGVRLAVVANRTLRSADAVAAEFSIPRATDDWREVVESRDVDAVFIGTWPYMHREVSIAALEAGKHVFCQARMAMDLADARTMADAAAARPDLVAMVCPPPTRMPYEPYITEVLVARQLGDLVSAELVSCSDANLRSDLLSWREDNALSGRNTLALGMYAETLEAWLGPYASLSALYRVIRNTKRRADGGSAIVVVPQVVTVTGTLASGALVTEHHSGMAADPATRTERLTVWGTEGTMRYCFTDGRIFFARPGGPLEPVEVDPALQNPWRVEQEFIDAVRGRPWPAGTVLRFSEALGYMRKVEAVYVSAERGVSVRLDDL